MTRVIVDDELLAVFSGAKGPLVLCLPDGTVIGHFLPANEVDYAALDPGVSDAELTRREQAGGGRPLVAILRDLAARP
jgi:hypothetical protein